MTTARSSLLCLAVFTSLTWASVSKAVVVYIDINNNPIERQAYRSALDQSHQAALKAAGSRKSLVPPEESFVSIPQQNDGDAAILKQLTSARDAVWTEYVKQGCFAAATCQPVLTGACGDIQTRLNAAEQAAANAPITLLNPTTLSQGLANLQLQPGEEITLVISGHFAGGQFTGNLAMISVADIQSVFAQFPDLQNAVTRLHLLGCYTNTLSQVQTMWRQAFPNANLIAGFYGPGPSGNNPLNLEFIHTLVAGKQTLNAIASMPQMEKTMVVWRKFAGINPALAVGDLYQEEDSKTPVQISASAERASDCQAKLPLTTLSYFQDVFNGVQPIPADTSHSPLRSYYSALRDNGVCLQEPEFTKLEPGIPSPDQAVRLIFYHNVVTNFMALHGPDIANFDQYLQSIGIDPSLSLKNLDLNDRQKVIAWRDAVSTQLGAVDNKKKVDRADGMLGSFSTILVELRPDCVPFDWVEPSGQHPSICFQVSGSCGNN